MQQYKYDENWDDWKIGDLIVWEDEYIEMQKIGGLEKAYPIKSKSQGYIYWDDPNGEENMTRETNLLRRIQAEASSSPAIDPGLTLEQINAIIDEQWPEARFAGQGEMTEAEILAEIRQETGEETPSLAEIIARGFDQAEEYDLP